MDFAVDSVTVHRGQRLEFVNDSGDIHDLVTGRNGLYFPEAGVPLSGHNVMGTNAVLYTGKWMKLGRFNIACTVHQHMNLTVVVVP